MPRGCGSFSDLSSAVSTATTHLTTWSSPWVAVFCAPCPLSLRRNRECSFCLSCTKARAWLDSNLKEAHSSNLKRVLFGSSSVSLSLSSSAASWHRASAKNSYKNLLVAIACERLTIRFSIKLRVVGHPWRASHQEHSHRTDNSASSNMAHSSHFAHFFVKHPIRGQVLESVCVISCIAQDTARVESDLDKNTNFTIIDQD